MILWPLSFCIDTDFAQKCVNFDWTLVKICTLDQHNNCFCHRCCCCCCCCCPADVDVPGSENTGGLGIELIRLPHSSYSDPAQMLHQSRLCKLLEWLNMCINQSYFYIKNVRLGQKRNLLLFCISQMNVFLCICSVLSLTQYWMRKSYSFNAILNLNTI